MMPFRETLRKKIELDRMARRAEQALPVVRKEYEHIDRDVVREFLRRTPYQPLKVRDLELYRHGGDGRAHEVLVLDNELPLYRNVSPEEVAMRRSPEVRDILHFGNVRKIMDDSDILVARGRKAISYIHDEIVSELDLSYNAGDIREIVTSARTALESGRTNDMMADLELFFDLLGYHEMEHEDGLRMYGRPEPAGYRDVVMVRDEAPSWLRLAAGTFAPEDDERMAELADIASGERPVELEGPMVIDYLGNEVLRLKAA